MDALINSIVPQILRINRMIQHRKDAQDLLRFQPILLGHFILLRSQYVGLCFDNKSLKGKKDRSKVFAFAMGSFLVIM